MLFQGSSFSFDPGMFLSAFLYASSAALFFTWSSAFGASCCCLFPFAIALTGATTASNAIAIAVMKFLIFKSFRIGSRLSAALAMADYYSPMVINTGPHEFVCDGDG